jgi:hypothetical protein
MIQLNPIQNYLEGKKLTIQLPDSGKPEIFYADYVHAKSEKDYYWIGYNEQGSLFRLFKSEKGLIGNIHIHSTNSDYLIKSISEQTKMLIKVNELQYSPNGDCSVELVEDYGPIDDSIDEGIEPRSCTPVIRVLFLFTPALVETFSSWEDELPMHESFFIAELNATCSASGLTASDISFVSAGAKVLVGFAEPNSSLKQ